MYQKKIFHKFKAKPQTIDDKYFGSKLEATYYRKLKAFQASGELLFFLRQVPVDLPGKTKYVADFLEFWKDGTVTFTDVKGHETETFKLKKRQVEKIYPFEINIVTRP